MYIGFCGTFVFGKGWAAMPERSADWMRQARHDLGHAAHAAQSGDFEWSCFAAQQASEKAVKALFQSRHKDAWGHTVSILLSSAAEHLGLSIPAALIDKAKVLDKHYIPARYPNGFENGSPCDFYTEAEAREAIALAEEILGFCENNLVA
jgi:HEPN domain-containing protein